MAKEVLDFIGLKCPQPVLKLTVKAPEIKAGDILEIVGDCPTFEKDIRAWCARLRRTILVVQDAGNNVKRIQIQF